MNHIDQATIYKLVDTATNIVGKYGVAENHTVGAAIIAQDGKVYSGLNLYHFTGGPCAEVVVLSNMISEGAEKPVAIVAIGDRDRGILAPCGRCRQILADYCPDIQVVVSDQGNTFAKDIKDLLPFTYIWADQQ